jgi:iron complex outermembrane receptor protein
VPFVPKFNASTALQYKHPQGYFARAEWLWKGKTYFNETRSAVLSQNDYSLLNLRIGYAKGGYSVYLFANNLTNSYYYTTKLGARGAPGDPRTLGIRLSVEF